MWIAVLIIYLIAMAAYGWRLMGKIDNFLRHQKIPWRKR